MLTKDAMTSSIPRREDTVHAIRQKSPYVMQGILDKLIVQNTTIDAILFLIQYKKGLKSLVTHNDYVPKVN